MIIKIKEYKNYDIVYLADSAGKNIYADMVNKNQYQHIVNYFYEKFPIEELLHSYW
jgi:hypothetical protein